MDTPPQRWRTDACSVHVPATCPRVVVPGARGVAMENGCAFLTLNAIGVWCDQM
jgi:hypothetical protein